MHWHLIMSLGTIRGKGGRCRLGVSRRIQRSWRVAFDLARPLNRGVDGKQLESIGTSFNCFSLPGLPMIPPCHDAMLFMRVDMEVPFNRNQPFHLESVELRHGEPCYFGPRSVLKGIVIQELATKEQCDGEHAVDLAT